jgi:hypothetical protein
MNTTTNTGITGIQLSWAEVRVLEFLRSKFLGVYSTASALNVADIKAGRAIYRKPKRIFTENYKNQSISTQKPTQDTIFVDLSYEKSAKYELETFDLSRLQGDISGQFQNSVAQSLTNSITAQLDAEFLKYTCDLAAGLPGQKQVVNTWFTPLTGGVIGDPTKSAFTLDQLKTMALQVNDIGDAIATTINEAMLGTDDDKRDIMIITRPQIYSRLVASNANSGDQSNEILSNGVLLNSSIHGRYVVKHPFMAKSLLKSDAKLKLDLDTDYNLGNYQALILHTEAIAMPFALNTITQAINPDNGNPLIIAKYNFGLGAVRPELIQVVTLT